MSTLSIEIHAYVVAHLPGATVTTEHQATDAFAVRVSTDRDSYTIQVSAKQGLAPEGASGSPVFQVLDADGDPLKDIYETWQDAADNVIAVLMPRAA